MLTIVPFNIAKAQVSSFRFRSVMLVSGLNDNFNCFHNLKILIVYTNYLFNLFV